MKTELHTFVTTAPIFNPFECHRIIQLAASKAAERGRVLSPSGSSLSLARKCDVVWLSPEDRTKWIGDRLWGIADEHNAQHWHFKLDRLSSLQYLRYPALGWYAGHVDNGSPAVSRRKLTISIQLSDPSTYLGGNLRIWGQQPERHGTRLQGAATIFPSHLWHRANPVLWGERHALVAWFEGNEPLR